MLDTLWQDLRLAFRTYAGTPTLTAALVVTIALGVGATTAMYAVVDAILLRPLPFPNSERAVVLCETNPKTNGWCGASPMNVADWARSSRQLDSAGVARTEAMIARGDGENYGVSGGITTPGFFRALRSIPALGRLLEERDMPKGANHVVVASHSFWQRRLGADAAAVGRTIVLDEEPYTVVGILPPSAFLPGDHLAKVELWKPISASVDDAENRNWRGFTAIGRLTPDATRESLANELEGIRQELAKAYPDSNKDWGLRVGDLKEHLVGNVSRTLWVFMAVVSFVLLIVCANVASLLLVRTTERASEFAVRASLGARGGRLARQLVTESLVISLAGGALGVLLSAWTLSGFVALAPTTIPRLSEVGLDTRVVLFAFGLAAATAVFFGLIPARQAARTDLSLVMRGVRTVGAGVRTRSTLVVAELALALVLLVGAGLLTRTFGRLLAWDPGFDRDGLVTTWMLPPASAGSAVEVMERVREQVASIPGVRSVALASSGPLFGGSETGGLQIEGRPPFPANQVPSVEWFNVDAHFVRTLGVKLLQGRDLGPRDVRGGPDAALVNETMVKRFFPGESPLGKRVTVDDHAAEIVGVIADVAPVKPNEPTPPQVFWPLSQMRRGASYLVIRTTPGIDGLEKAVRARAASVNPAIQLSAFLAMDERFEKNLVSPRFNMLLVVAFAGVAVLLAAVGIYGVIASAVTRRTRELGLRVALGATPGSLVSSITRQGLVLAGIGLGIGGIGALALGRLLSSLLYGLPPNDPLTLAAAAGLFAIVAGVASWLPARRASRIDPIAALRDV